MRQGRKKRSLRLNGVPDWRQFKGFLGSGLRFVWLAAAFSLSGCGNARQSINVGEWTEVETALPPVSVGDAYTVETTQSGNGRVVSPGDLVKARLQVVTADPATAAHDVWVWVGREPTPDPRRQPPDTSARYGDMGSARFREALIGRRLHETFFLRGIAYPSGSGDEFVPFFAFQIGEILGGLGATADDEAVAPPLAWPVVKLRVPNDAPEIRAHVEILQVCDARLYQRTAIMRQWGIILFEWGGNPPVARKTELGWSKIEADCPAPEGRLQVQIGPLSSSWHSARRWDHTYLELRPPSRFPEEWSAARARPGMDPAQ